VHDVGQKQKKQNFGDGIGVFGFLVENKSGEKKLKE